MFKQNFVIGLAALFLFTLQPVFAQPAKQEMPGMQQRQKMTPEEMIKKDEERVTARVDELTKKLNLTPEQQAKVKDALTGTAAEIRKVMQQTRMAIEELMKNDREAIKAFLTEEQQKILEAMRPKPGQGQVPPPQQPLAEGK